MNNFVDSLVARVGSSAHERLVVATAEALRDREWDVETEPRVGQVSPDLLARDTDGTTYVIEIKSGASNAFLGAVAQVEAQVESYRKERGTAPRGVLLFAGDAPSALDDVAKKAGVELVHVQSDRPAAVAKSLSRLSESTITDAPESAPTNTAPQVPR